MIPIPYQLGIIAASAILSGAMGFGWGYSRASDRYAPEVAQLKSAIEAGYDAVKIQQAKSQENLNENRKIARDLASRIAAGADIDAARVRELQARSKALAAALTSSAAGDIRESCEQDSAGKLVDAEIKFIELKDRCIIDAAARVIIRDWAIREGFKPAQ